MLHCRCGVSSVAWFAAPFFHLQPAPDRIAPRNDSFKSYPNSKTVPASDVATTDCKRYAVLTSFCAADIAVWMNARRKFEAIDNIATTFRMMQRLEMFPIFHGPSAVVFPFDDSAFRMMIENDAPADPDKAMFHPHISHFCGLFQFSLATVSTPVQP